MTGEAGAYDLGMINLALPDNPICRRVASITCIGCAEVGVSLSCGVLPVMACEAGAGGDIGMVK